MRRFTRAQVLAAWKAMGPDQMPGPDGTHVVDEPPTFSRPAYPDLPGGAHHPQQFGQRPPPRRIAIVGSRNFPYLQRVRDYVRSLPPDTIIISGGARGPDRVAVDEATRRGMTTEVYRADWSKGRSAGFQRNAIIVERCDTVVAFWDGDSRGTAHTLQLARAAGKTTYVIGAA